MKKIILFLSLLIPITLEAGPTIIANDQLDINGLVASHTVSIASHTLDIGNLVASDVAQDIFISSHTVFIASHTGQINAIVATQTIVQNDISTLQSGKYDKTGGQITGQVQILNDNLKLGLNGSANGNSTLSFSGFVSSANATATLYYDDTDGKLKITDAAGTTVLSNASVVTLQNAYNNQVPVSTIDLVNGTGFLRFRSNAGVNILEVDEALEKVTIKELAVTNNAIITGNLTVNGTNTIFNTTTTQVDALTIIPALNGNHIDIVPSINLTTGNYLSFQNTNAGPANFVVDINGNITTAGTYKGVAITSTIRSANSSFWKKGVLANGDVFGYFLVPDAMNLTTIEAKLITPSTTGAVTYNIEKSTDSGVTFTTILTGGVGTIGQTLHVGTPPTLAVTTVAKDDILKVSVTSAGTSLDASDLMIRIVGNYAN